MVDKASSTASVRAHVDMCHHITSYVQAAATAADGTRSHIPRRQHERRHILKSATVHSGDHIGPNSTPRNMTAYNAGIMSQRFLM